MGLISDLLGVVAGKTKARTISDVEGALAKLGDERSRAREAIAVAMTRRDELLLQDGTDLRIAEADAEADKARLVLERCDAAEPLLLRELAQLRTEAKQAQWAKLRERYDAAAVAHAGAMRAAVGTATVMLDLNTEARSAGFEHETQAAFIPPARMISTESVNQFEFAAERARELGKPAPAVVAMPKVGAAAPKVVAVPAKPAPAPVAPKPPPKPAFVPQPDANGNLRITVLRPGIEIEGRARPKAGETIALPAADAMRVVRSGHAEFDDALKAS